MSSIVLSNGIMLLKTPGDTVVLNVIVSGHLILHTFGLFETRLIFETRIAPFILDSWSWLLFSSKVPPCWSGIPVLVPEQFCGVSQQLPLKEKLDHFCPSCALLVQSWWNCQHPRHTSDMTLNSTPEPPCFHGHGRAGEWARPWRDSVYPRQAEAVIELLPI